MKRLLFLWYILLTGITVSAQINLDSIPPLFKKMDGDGIREAYSFTCFIPYIASNGKSRESKISIAVFSSPKLQISSHSRPRLQAVEDFIKDTAFLHQRYDVFYHTYFAAMSDMPVSYYKRPDVPIPIFDSSAMVVILNGVNHGNADGYEFRVLKNKVEELLPWHDVHLFIPPYIGNSSASHLVKEAAFLGLFRTTFGNNLTIDVRKKGTDKILLSTTAIWINHPPAVLGVFAGNDSPVFSVADAVVWENGHKEATPSQKTIVNDSTLVLRTSFDSHENNLLFYLDDKMSERDMIEYRLVSKHKSVPWVTNHDFNLIALRDLRPGTYDLQMRYIIQRQNVSHYTFTIQPAWYQTFVFRLFVSLCLLFLVILVVLFIKTKRKQRAILIEQFEKQKNEAALQSIRSQLNPHFVFNALNSIQGLINQDEVGEANRYLSEFSTLMRNTLEGNDHDLISLMTERKMLESYLQLEQLRFGFTYHIHCDESLDPAGIEIPALLTQPLVENAVKHGVSPLYEQGKIEIEFKRSEQDLVIRIMDNGKGFSEKPGVGYGLKLTRERIRLLNKMSPHTAIHFQVDRVAEETVARLTFKNWLS